MARKPGNPHKKRMHKDGRLYGKYKVKPNAQISREDLERALNGKVTSYGHKPKYVKILLHKSYVAFVYWVGPRKMEPTTLKKEDLTVTETHVYVQIVAFKGGERAGPLKIPRHLPGIELVVARWETTRKKRRLWPFSRSTAYRVVTRALGRCPHWLRHNWMTTQQQKMEGPPSEVDRKIMAWTGVQRRETLDKYRLKQKKDIDDVSDILG